MRSSGAASAPQVNAPTRRATGIRPRPDRVNAPTTRPAPRTASSTPNRTGRSVRPPAASSTSAVTPPASSATASVTGVTRERRGGAAAGAGGQKEQRGGARGEGREAPAGGVSPPPEPAHRRDTEQHQQPRLQSA